MLTASSSRHIVYQVVCNGLFAQGENMSVLRMLLLIVGVGIVYGACQSGEVLEPEDYGQSEQQLLLGSALGTAVATGNTCGLNNSMSPRCVTSVASDESHAWTAPSNGTYIFTVTSTDFLNVLAVAPLSTPFSALGCASGGTSSTLRLALTAGQQLQITIDGQAALCGHYTLGITKECPSDCQSPPLCKAPGSCTVNGVCSFPPLCSLGEVCRNNECIPRCLIDPSFPC